MEQSDIVEKAQDSLKKLASTGIGMSLTAWDEVSNNLLECTTEITRLRAALADYERRILSAVEAVPASQIRAEALREAAALVDAGTFRTNEKGDFCGHDIEQHEYCDECLSKQILALIDAPKVTT